MNSSDASMSPTRSAAPAAARWHLRLLGALEAHDGQQRIERFPSRAVAALLARLALAPERAHAREELVELLWPGVALDVGRNRLRQALSTLKSLLEPPGVPGSAVLQADRLALRVVRGAIDCDAVDFERALRAGRFEEARALYRGELMPGFYDEWIADERQRLQALADRIGDAPPPPQQQAYVAATPLPAPARAGEPASALPSYLTRLFGAEIATARLRAAVLAHRLVTLLGPGGSGKTRLAVEVAQALREPMPWAAEGAAPLPFHRVLFVPLVACEDRASVLDALARALQLRAAAADADGLLQAVAQALAGQRALLVLDNFEQLVGQAEGLVAELLARLPSLHVLATSRRLLGLDGEQQASAEPLPLPAPLAPLAAVAANPAVALFVDRARAVRADFHLGERNQAAIAELVRQLGGLPLAVELAASRVRSLPPAEMLAMLQSGERGAGLALLARAGPRGGSDPRHASMAQVIAWSWRLLDEAAQRTLGALAVFPADATAAAAAQVLGDGVAATAARLDDLVGHSLLRCVAAAGDAPTRFLVLEPVREFVLAQAGEADLAAWRAGLRRWLRHWAAALPAERRPAYVAPELPAVHAALAAAREAPEDALQLAIALRRYWETDGLPPHLLDALEAALRAIDAVPDAAPWLSDAHELLAHLQMSAGHAEAAIAHAAAAVERAGTDPARRGRALLQRGWSALAFGRIDERASVAFRALVADLDEALALARASGELESQARALHLQAVVRCNIHISSDDADPATAERLFAESEALWRRLGDASQVRERQRNRAQCQAALGRPREAMAVFERCERSAAADGDWVGQMDSQVSLCSVLAQLREWGAALAACRRSIALAHDRWHLHGLAYGLWNIARPLARQGRPLDAARLIAFAQRLWVEGMGPLRADDRRYVRIVRRLAEVQAGRAQADAAWAEGLALDLPAAVRLALA